MIEALELTKHFEDRKRGRVTAVDGVSFTSRPGEIFGILGPNGAGKTTLLRMLATILEPSGGSARVGGADIRKQPEEVRRSIGFLTGAAALYERLTAREVVSYFAKLHGLSREHREA